MLVHDEADTEFLTRGMYAVYDSKASAFMAPFMALNEAVATRWFATMVNDPESQFSQFPEDFTLFWIGSFQEKSGRLEALDSPESVVRAQVLVKKDAERQA